jgi:hypothetical protein
MIKRNRQPEPDNKIGASAPPVTAPVESKIQTPDDVVIGEGRYVLKTLQTSGTVDSVKTALAAKLSEAEKAGYRYVDRIPANQTESVLVFELNK